MCSCLSKSAASVRKVLNTSGPSTGCESGRGCASGLSDETWILVSEIACRLPGCPPRKTVIAFWENEKRYQFKIFKPAAAVVPDDFPPAWQKDLLAVPVEFACECC